MAILFVTAFVMRISYLGIMPANLNPDEADTLHKYMQVMYSPGIGNLSIVGINWNGAPLVNVFLIGGSWELFGRSIFGLRFPSAVLTSLTVVCMYWVIWKRTRSVIWALLIATAFSVNPWFLNFSRSGWENAWNTLYLAIMIIGYELVDTRRRLGFGLIVLGAVLGFYGYHPGKLYLIPMIVAFISVKWGKKKEVYMLRAIAIGVISYVILISPQIFTSLLHPYDTTDRIRDVSIFHESDAWSYFLNSSIKNIRGLFLWDPAMTYVGLNSRYLPQGVGFINLLLLPLFLVGFVTTLIGRRKERWYVWTLLIVLLPVQLLSRETPNAARGVHAVGFYYLFIAMGGSWLWSYFTHLVRHTRPRVVVLVPVMLSTVVIFVIFQDSFIYNIWISNKTTLAAREPAVTLEEYPVWRDTLLQSISHSGRGFNVDAWKSMQKKP